MTAAADGDGYGVFAREFQTAPHVLDVRGAYHRERAAIVSKVPDLPCFVETRRTPTQQSPTNVAGKIVEIGSWICGREDRQDALPGPTQSHGTGGDEPGPHEIAAAPCAGIGLANAHRLVLCQKFRCLTTLAGDAPGSTRTNSSSRHRRVHCGSKVRRFHGLFRLQIINS